MLVLQADITALHFGLLSKRRACDVYTGLRRKRADTKTSICTLGTPCGAQKFCDGARRTTKLYVIAKAMQCNLMISSSLRSRKRLLNGLKACGAAVRGK